MDSEYIASSFEACGITSQYNLHSTLNFMMRTNSILNDYIDDLNEEDDIDGFADDENDFMNDTVARNSPDIEPITTISQVSPITLVETRVNQSPYQLVLPRLQERAPDEIHQRLLLQALPSNTNRPQTPVAVLNKNGSVRKPLGRKPGSKNKPKNANL
ncbi:unnamed protein product [Brachionus calyciflorus]|uniref:Uncharacterized protein n=1 Tax=Brachionus calyciflorus TaxID=104777 RepID=A0A814PM18_9BILA|nr:unnamed protein product [Brachionus calyciflorus]